MCDYSLHHVASRPARVGDRLVATRFGEALTRGFSSPTEPEVAVCLSPGTELTFDFDVECERAIKIFGKRNLRQRVARFRQVNEGVSATHHDALEFPSGEIVLVTRLVEGQRATVLQLPATERTGGNPSVRARIRTADAAVAG